MSSRRDTRVSASLSVVLTTDERSVMGVAKDISVGGMFVATSERPKGHSPVAIDIVARGRHIACQGRITSQNQYGVGLAFDRATAPLRELVAELHAGAMTGGREKVVASSARVEVQWGWWDDLAAAKSWTKATTHMSVIVSLSPSGAALIGEKRPAVDEILAIRIRKPQDVTGRARVVRHTAEGFAVSFEGARVDFQRAVGLLLSGLR